MNNPGPERRFQQSKAEGGNLEATNHSGVRFTKANRRKPSCATNHKSPSSFSQQKNKEIRSRHFVKTPSQIIDIRISTPS